MERVNLSRMILEAMDKDVTRAETVIASRDVLLLFPKMPPSAVRVKAACFVDSITNHYDQDAFIKSVFQDAEHCIEIIIFDNHDTLKVFDATNPRWRVLFSQDLDEEVLSCLKKYMITSNKIFLDPIFDDHVFKKNCWDAFQESMDILQELDGIVPETQACIILQALIIAMLHNAKYLDYGDGELGTIVQRMGSENIFGINLAPAILVGEASMPSITAARLLAPWQSIPGYPDQLDEITLCFLMERSLTEAFKKKSGSYYTPRTWAWLACHRSLQSWLTKNHPNENIIEIGWIKKIQVLDPAMGSGDFLDAMVDVLVEAMLEYGAETPGNYPFDWNLARLHAKIDHVFSMMLHGIDVNPIAVAMTRARFFLNVLKHVMYTRDTTSFAAPFKIDLIHDDYLTRHMTGTAYDIIIGNPPYLMEVRNNMDIFRKYSTHPETSKHYEPKMDVFYFFMFKNIEVLNDLGIMSIFVQEYWLDRYHAHQLRNVVFQAMVPLNVILFKRYKVFQGAPGHHSMLFVACKQDPASPDASGHVIVVHDEKVMNVDLLEEILYQTGRHVHDTSIDAATFYDARKDKVYTDGSEEKQFFENLHAMPHFFISEDEIQVGINIPQPFIRKAGRVEGVFVLPAETLDRMGLSIEEQLILKPFHKATDIDAFSFITKETLFIIYTTNDAKNRVEESPDLYPVIRSHLDHYASSITSDHKPYGLHRPRQPEWFEAPLKIIGIRKTKVPKFAVVPQDYYMDQAAVFIKLNSHANCTPYFLCAYLNSCIAARMLGAMKSQGDQLQIDKSVLVKLPIPIVSTGVNRVVSILSSWLHVIRLTNSNGFAARIEAGLAKSIESIIDTIFKEDLRPGVVQSTMLENLEEVLHDVEPIHLEACLETSSTNASLPGVKTTRIDANKFLDMLSSILPKCTDLARLLTTDVARI
jgi:hypothetical protein